jgi:hypothetical protein
MNSHRHLFRPLPALAAAAGVLLLGALALSPAGAAAGDDPPAGPADVRADVWRIVEKKCLRCHNNRDKGGQLDMSSRASMLEGGASGPALVVGEADKSLMIDLVDFDEMPPRKEQPRVEKDELKLLREWINAGAPGREPAQAP